MKTGLSWGLITLNLYHNFWPVAGYEPVVAIKSASFTENGTMNEILLVELRHSVFVVDVYNGKKTIVIMSASLTWLV